MQDFSELLERQHKDINQLLETLMEEQTALTSNNLADIEATTAAKQARMADIEQHLQQQACLLMEANLALDDNGMAAFLRRYDPQARAHLELRWRQIKELFSRCREQNLLNGRIVTINHRQTQRVLAILRGGGPNDDDCYSRRGQTNNNLSSRSLGKV